jgi:hypothetical protein
MGSRLSLVIKPLSSKNSFFTFFHRRKGKDIPDLLGFNKTFIRNSRNGLRPIITLPSLQAEVRSQKVKILRRIRMVSKWKAGILIAAFIFSTLSPA